MNGLTLEGLKRDATDFDVLKSDVYERTYWEMTSYFQSVKIFEEKHLILFAQLIYGAMPTMVNIKLDNPKLLLSLFSKVKGNTRLTIGEILVIKKYINNSLVGTSKLLHFLNPHIYAIWDSRIYRYITQRKGTYGIDDVGTYLNYLDSVKSISLKKDYCLLHEQIAKHFSYPIAPSRVLEIIMFQTDKLNQRSIAEAKKGK